MRLLKHLPVLISFLFFGNAAYSQACTTLGQTPSTAFPVCGVDTFSQTTVPYCVNKNLPTPGCTGQIYPDTNPFYYRFTCYSKGTLGFLIAPNNPADEDYDWQIFDITGRNPNDIYTDASLFVVANWAGTYGNTGTSPTALHNIECGSNPSDLISTFSRSPILIEGHTYLLMISHYSSTPNGYKLSFGGGTASITDPVDPDFKSATTSCDGTQIRIKLSKKMKCNTLTVTGSEFRIPGTTVTITSAVGIGCSNGFDMDSIILNLSEALPPGNYFLKDTLGSDDNTLLDYCDQAIPVGATVPFIVYGRQPTPFDSVATVACAPGSLTLVFKKNIVCSSIASDGTDFSVTGPFPVTVTSATGNCVDDLSSTITLNLAAPIVHQGTYTITLKSGGDGNTIIDECGIETPISGTIDFFVKDTVSAAFTYNLFEGCREDSIYLYHNGANGVNQWYWTFEEGQNTNVQNPRAYYTTFGDKSIKLWVSNGFCSDSTELKLYLNHDTLRAAFTGPSVYCPNDLAYFRDTSKGTILNWNWEFGNGRTSTLQYPPAQVYPQTDKERLFPVRLIVLSDKQCTDTSLKYIKVVNNCYIAVPSAFTPNKDGRNDYLYPLNAFKATHLEFKIYNKYGQLVFETKDWTRKWDGTINGTEQQSGVFVWFLQYTDGDTGKQVLQKGTTVLIR